MSQLEGAFDAIGECHVVLLDSNQLVATQRIAINWLRQLPEELDHVIRWLTGFDEQKVRYLDKLVDERAKGKPMEKILRA